MGTDDMYVVYIIKSYKKNWFYIGLARDASQRLIQHNNGKVRSTKAFKPLLLIYKKTFPSLKEARDFEKFLKVRSNKEKLLRSLGVLLIMLGWWNW